jgi:hypothetical protein
MEEEIGQKIFQQVMDIWVIPEIERRKYSGRIDQNFILNGAQIVFSFEWRFPKIRINDEIKAVMEGKINRDIKKGEKVYEKDLDSIESIKLTNEDSNCGHITILRFRDKWVVSFDANYNKKIRKEYLDASKEFYKSASENLDQNYLRVFYDNAFSSAELCALSILLSWSSKKIINDKKHYQRIEFFEKAAEVNKTNHPKLLRKLKNLRQSARYLSNDDFQREKHEEIKSALKEMIDFANTLL